MEEKTLEELMKEVEAPHEEPDNFEFAEEEVVVDEQVHTENDSTNEG